MKEIYKEQLHNGKILHIPYDTDSIKDTCVDCGRKIQGDLKKNYEMRGNYCASCNGKYGKSII